MLFLCKWEDINSLLIDDESDAAAREVATKVGGTPPCTVVALPPRTFVAEVEIYDDECDDEDEVDARELVAIEPLQHVAEALYLLDRDGDDGGASMFAGSNVLRGAQCADGGECASEAEDGPSGTVYVCTLDKGHEGDHEARDGGGKMLMRWWEQ